MNTNGGECTAYLFITCKVACREMSGLLALERVLTLLPGGHIGMLFFVFMTN